MNKFNIEESEIYDIFNKIVDEDLNENEFEFIDSIQSYIDTLILWWKIEFDWRSDINNKICAFIDEKINENKEWLSLNFLKKIHGLRIREYVWIILSNKKNTIWNKDTFILKSDNDIDLANSEIENQSKGKNYNRVGIDKKNILTLEYFSNKENVMFDLLEFAKRTKTWNVADLHMWNPDKNTKVIIKRWIEISWYTYLSKFWFVLTKRFWNWWKAIKEFKSIINVEPFSKEYFMNKENIEKDLDKFMKNNDLDDYNSMEISHFKNNDNITANNWKEINFTTYIRNASKYLLWTNDTPDNPVQAKNAFIELKKILWLDVKVVTEEFSKEYFNNPDNILYDLNLFKEHIKLNTRVKEKSIYNLMWSNTDRTKTIITKWGREVSLYMYIHHVSREIFWTKLQDAKFEDSMNYIKKVIWIEPLSESYYNNKENIAYDLWQFLESSNVKDISELKFTEPKTNTKVKIKNWKEIAWKAYLWQASKIFYWTSYTDKSNQPRFSEALWKLKSIL